MRGPPGPASYPSKSPASYRGFLFWGALNGAVLLVPVLLVPVAFGCVEVPLDEAQVKATVVGAEQGHFADGDLAQGGMGEYLALQVVGWARL